MRGRECRGEGRGERGESPTLPLRQDADIARGTPQAHPVPASTLARRISRTPRGTKPQTLLAPVRWLRECRTWLRFALPAAWLLTTLLVPPLAAQTRVLDAFDSIAAWKAAPADGVKLELASDTGRTGQALQLSFDFQGHGGWAAVRRRLPVTLPKNWELSFWIRGNAPSNTLEVKLTDPTGENVWWSVRREFVFPGTWQRVRVKSKQLTFAWGPGGGGELKNVGFFEVAITAGDGGQGTVWLDDLTLTELPSVDVPPPTPEVTASSSLPGGDPESVLTGAGTGWRSDPAASANQWLAIDFGVPREIGGLAIDWSRELPPQAFEVAVSDDGVSWQRRWEVARAHGGRSWVPLPDTGTRFVRVLVTAAGDGGVGAHRVVVQLPDFARSPNDLFAAVARDARRGLYPRGFLDEQTVWTVVADQEGGALHGLLSGDGAFEPAQRSLTLEPFIWLEGGLVTWADVTTTQALAEGALPIPTVTWTHPAFTLAVTAFANDTEEGPRDVGDLPHLAFAHETGYVVRYRLTNRRARPLAARLVVAVRPLQVNPPSQFLNTPGGVAPTGSVQLRGPMSVEGEWEIAARPLPYRRGATPFDGGDVVGLLDRGVVPEEAMAVSPYASGALTWDLVLEPHGATEATLAVSGAKGDLAYPPWLADADTAGVSAAVAARLEASEAVWRDRLRSVEIVLPDGGELARTVRANLGFILASRDGAALQPGTRAYARSWIRDGAMMAAALLRLGQDEAVRDYILWFAPHVYESGKVPCVVDKRGADPVPEHDSQGEFVFMVAEYLRFTGDRETAAAVWPQVTGAVRYLDELRQTRRTDAYRTPDKLAFYGMLPESISHEGYSAKPMHAYWDSFWALRGMKDAVWLAGELGHPEEQARWTAIRDELAADLKASVARTMADHYISHLPGCVELGDFDPTSSTVIPTIAQASDLVPPGSQEATWERTWQEVEARFTGKRDWDVYTPYEWRNVGAMVRLGWRERAFQLATWLMGDRRPLGWNQWAEVVTRDAHKARFIGDMPHAWVASDFIRSFLDILAYEDEARDALVLGAGIPASWLEGEGVTVKGLQTRHGTLSTSMKRTADGVVVHIEGGLRPPSGGVVLRLPGPFRSASVDGQAVPVTAGGEVAVRTLPADVLLSL